MYFENFPLTYYSLDDIKSVQVVTNILLRVVFNDSIKNNLSLFDEYDIREGDTPEIVADLFYNNPQFHWIILHMNDILDPRFDWPLTSNNLIKYCQNKYANIYATHHYEDVDGNWVNSNYPNATSISNFTYEDKLNEAKRRIKILKPRYIESIVREFNKKFEGVNV